MKSKRISRKMPRGYGIVQRAVMEDPNLSIQAKALYALLASKTGANVNSECYPKQETLAQYLNVSVRTVINYLNELLNYGLIIKSKRFNDIRQHNKYEICYFETDETGEFYNDFDEDNEENYNEFHTESEADDIAKVKRTSPSTGNGLHAMKNNNIRVTIEENICSNEHKDTEKIKAKSSPRIISNKFKSYCIDKFGDISGQNVFKFYTHNLKLSGSGLVDRRIKHVESMCIKYGDSRLLEAIEESLKNINSGVIDKQISIFGWENFIPNFEKRKISDKINKSNSNTTKKVASKVYKLSELEKKHDESKARDYYICKCGYPFFWTEGTTELFCYECETNIIKDF